MKKWHAQIISHTHWDREWYLNSKYTTEWLVPFFDQLFDMFAREPEYQFVLDGQMLMVDDYLEELKKAGKPVYQYKQKLKKYTREGRLHIGPYYLQPDWQLLSDEALVRNLTVGLKKAAEYGPAMTTGWLLDNFGQISQTSQIHAEVGLKGLYAWRGVEMDPTNVQSEFIWESPDGTRLPTVYLLNSYRNVMRLAEYPKIMKRRILDEVEKLKDFMITKNVLLMNGYDQEMVPDDIQPYIQSGVLNTDEITVSQSNPPAYLASVLAENPDLITLKGALYSGRFISVFPGVMSARMYLKLQNDKSQKAIEKYAEPLGTLDWLIGGEYPQVTFDKSWELILRNHPHDSICGVSIDDVHSDMEERTRDFHFLVDDAIDRSIANLALRIDTSSMQKENFFVFNPAPYPRDEVVSVEGQETFVKDIPAFGYKAVTANDGTRVTVDGKTIKNGKLKVTINDNGTVDMLHLATGKTYKGLGAIKDAGDAGDEYNYSYPDKDKYFYSTDQQVKVDFVSVQDAAVEVEISCDMQVPISVTADRKQRSTETAVMPIRTRVRIEAGADMLKFKTTIKNTVKDHIVYALFPTGIETKTAFAGSQFDVVERPVHIDEYDESMIPENVRKVIVGAREAKPNTIFLGRELVDLNDGKVGLAVLSKGLPEYTVIEDGKNTVALTLFRSVGWVAKEINTRIGDAGPEIFTPEAQCLRQMEFEYAVYPHAGHYDEGGVLPAADRFNSDVMVFVTGKHDGQLPTEKSFLTVTDSANSVRVTSINRASDGKGVVVRLYNGGTKTTTVTIASGMNLKSAKRIDFLGNQKESLLVKDNGFVLPVCAKVIETLHLELESESLPVAADFAELYAEEVPYDLTAYECQPLVTEAEIQAELDRADALKDRINDPMWRRTALEAQLSAILAKDRFNEVVTHGLGYELNTARVHRRIHDYIKDLGED